MGVVGRYGLALIFSIGSFVAGYCQGSKKIVFPVTIVIFSGIDTIYCFEDSLTENSKLTTVNTENEFIGFMDERLKTIVDIDTGLYRPMIRFNTILTEKFGNQELPFDRVFVYNAKIKSRIEVWFRDEYEDSDYFSMLKKLIKKRLNK